MIAAQAILRLLLALGTYFTQDDFVFYTLGATHRFDLEYLFQDRGNHLMPAGQALVWPLAQYLPLEHGPAVLAMVVLQVAASLGVFWLLRELFGLRTALLAPLAFYLFGSLTLPAFLWWSAALNAVGLQLAMALTLASFVRMVRLGRRRWGVGVLAFTLLGLTSFEKAVLLLPLLVGVAWVVERTGQPGRDLLRVLRRHWLLWTLIVVEVGAWTLLYLHQVSTGYAADPASGVAADLVVDSVTRGLVPALFSGPWHWDPAVVFLGYAPAPPTWLLILSWTLLLAFVGVSLAVRRGMGRIWIVTVGYIGADLVLLIWGRAGAFGPGVGLEYRYFADSAIVFAVLVGYAFLPLRWETDPWRSETNTLRQWARAHGDLVRGVAWAALVLWTVGACWSSIMLGQAWRANPARSFIETAKDSLASAPSSVELLDEPVPQTVLLGWFQPYNGTSYVFAPLHHHPPFVTSVTDLWTIADDGTLQLGVVNGVRTTPGPASGCGWAVTDAHTTIPLDKKVFDWNWTVKVAYLAGADSTARFTLGDTTVEVPVRRGLHDVYFSLPGAGRSVSVSLATPGAGMCIDRIDVGNSVPVASEEALNPPAAP